MKKIACALGLALLWIVPSFAAAPVSGTGTRVIAKIVQLQGRALQVTTADGSALSVTLPENVPVMHQVPASLSDVKSGEFIGCTAMEGADKKLIAQEIHILPESMRGAGEGHYPWGDAPNTTMTNGNVEQFEGVTEGKSLHVSYKGGESEILIPASATVTRIETLSLDQLKAGVQVMLYMVKDDAGATSVRYVSVIDIPSKP